MPTLRTFSLAFAPLSCRERLRTDRLWYRLSERPSWRPPDVEVPSLPSLRPEATSDKQLKKGQHKKRNVQDSENINLLLTFPQMAAREWQALLTVQMVLTDWQRPETKHQILNQFAH